MTNPFPPIPHPESMPLNELLRLRLSWLTYLAFAMCVSRILRHLGYSDIPLPSRRSFKGPNAHGGVDMFAREETGLGTVPVLVRLKQYRGPRPVARSAVDELRGALTRLGVSHGIIITTVGFSIEARDAAANYPGRPIRLIDGNEIGRLAEACRIGLVVKEDPSTNSKSLVYDENWFELLEDYCEGLRNSKTKKGDHGKE